jgi:bacterioferritin (cytochrome b1)
LARKKREVAVPEAPNDDVIDALQSIVSVHLQAIETYQSQATHFRRWGYGKLSEEFENDADDERVHLNWAMARLEFYKVVPTASHDEPLDWPPNDFAGILTSNYELEQTIADMERRAIKVCRDAGDEVSAIGIIPLLVDSEASLAKIEATKSLIEQIGLDNYLSTKV